MAVLVDDAVAGPTANSFISVAWADGFFDASIYGTSWAALTPDLKSQAVISATRWLSTLRYQGAPTTASQALPWPRVGVVDRMGRSVGSMVIPPDLQAATAELARSLSLAPDPLLPSATAGVESVKAGSLEVHFATGMGAASAGAELPDVVWAYLAPWILPGGGGTALTTVPLLRV